MHIAAPQISIIVPTRRRPAKLANLLKCLATQSLTGNAVFETLIGIDGLDDPESVAVSQDARDLHGLTLHTWAFAQEGIAAIKNRLIEHAAGEILLFVNDDVRPAPDFIEQHRNAHSHLLEKGRRAMVLGYSPWLVPEDGAESQFDRLLAQTSMVFFYDRMMAHADDRDRDWGFRHAWNLNLSVPADAVRAVGGFQESLCECCYEDIELGYRLSIRESLPVLFRPGARADHDHRYTPAGYLEREQRLGRSAAVFAETCPECAQTVFGLNLLSDEHLAYCKQYVENESRREPEMLPVFTGLASRPADTWSGDEWIPLAYTQHLPLKRLAFRRGLLEAVEKRA
ncbi:MAG: glycosyltransferase family 2 protein [Planctomycetes bacterium]|nr:glycosyltransferase family 2 protein [Planctomycetota bacterium]